MPRIVFEQEKDRYVRMENIPVGHLCISYVSGALFLKTVDGVVQLKGNEVYGNENFRYYSTFEFIGIYKDLGPLEIGDLPGQ